MEQSKDESLKTRGAGCPERKFEGWTFRQPKLNSICAGPETKLHTLGWLSMENFYRPRTGRAGCTTEPGYVNLQREKKYWYCHLRLALNFSPSGKDPLRSRGELGIWIMRWFIQTGTGNIRLSPQPPQKVEWGRVRDANNGSEWEGGSRAGGKYQTTISSSGPWGRAPLALAARWCSQATGRVCRCVPASAWANQPHTAPHRDRAGGADSQAAVSFTWTQKNLFRQN